MMAKVLYVYSCSDCPWLRYESCAEAYWCRHPHWGRRGHLLDAADENGCGECIDVTMTCSASCPLDDLTEAAT